MPIPFLPLFLAHVFCLGVLSQVFFLSFYKQKQEQSQENVISRQPSLVIFDQTEFQIITATKAEAVACCVGSIGAPTSPT